MELRKDKKILLLKFLEMDSLFINLLLVVKALGQLVRIAQQCTYVILIVTTKTKQDGDANTRRKFRASFL